MKVLKFAYNYVLFAIGISVAILITVGIMILPWRIGIHYDLNIPQTFVLALIFYSFIAAVPITIAEMREKEDDNVRD